jgi:hypothetical protein
MAAGCGSLSGRIGVDLGVEMVRKISKIARCRGDDATGLSGGYARCGACAAAKRAVLSASSPRPIPAQTLRDARGFARLPERS